MAFHLAARYPSFCFHHRCRGLQSTCHLHGKPEESDLMLLEAFLRMWHNFLMRPNGPLHFRFVLQPAMAIFLAFRAGRADSRAGRPPYFWATLVGHGSRRALLKSAWKDVARLYCLAVVLDVIFSIITFKWVYPLESILIAFALACVPYVLVRGPVNRLFTHFRKPVQQDREDRAA